MKQILAKIRDSSTLSRRRASREAPNIELKSKNTFDFTTSQVLTQQDSFSLNSRDITPSHSLFYSSEKHENTGNGKTTAAVKNKDETSHFTYGSRYFHECPKSLVSCEDCVQCGEDGADSYCESNYGTLTLRRNSQSSDEMLRHIVMPMTPEMTGRKVKHQQETTSNFGVQQKDSRDVINSLLSEKQTQKPNQLVVPTMKNCQEKEEIIPSGEKDNSQLKPNFGGVSVGEFHSPRFIPKRNYSKKKKAKAAFHKKNLTKDYTLSSIVETDEELEMTSSSSEGSSSKLPLDSEGPESLVDDLDDLSSSLHHRKNNSPREPLDIKNTLIHRVVNDGDITMLEGLINQGYTNLNQSDHQGWPPLLQAVKKGNILCAKLLLKNKAKLNFVHKNTGNCLLHKLAEEGSYEAVEFLLQQGANPNILNHKGWPALHAALHAHQFKCAALLIRSGTDVTYYTHKRIEEYCSVVEMSKGFQQHWQLEI